MSERRGTTTTFSHSGLKNADAQSGVSQAVNATQQYDAFGNLASSTGTWQGQFGFGGGFGYQQDATGLKLLGHRYYDASTGRFLTRDPIKDGRNWYVYVGNDPVGAVDPSGLSLHRWIYTGNWNAEDDVYNAALNAAATKLIGRTEMDPEGYEVRVGGPMSYVNPMNNAITPDGITYIHQENEDLYWRHQWWRDHEHRHVHQRLEIADEMGIGHLADEDKTVAFISAILMDYAASGSHDDALLERDANNWAYNLAFWRLL